METQRIETDVCVAGGGPAGLVAALLLLKAGYKVTVLERHPNFDREYRGEVLMPRFIQMFKALNLLEYVESHEHLKLFGLEIFYKEKPVVQIELSKVVPDAPYAIWMPQPILLEALNAFAKSFSNYKIHFSAPVTDLIIEDGAVRGVIAGIGDKRIEVRAKVTIGADGRSSSVYRKGGFEMAYEQHEFDILWFTIARPSNYGRDLRGFLSPHRNYLILPKHPDLLQCGLVLKPGEYPKFIHAGIDAMKRELVAVNSMFEPFAGSLTDFEPFALLQAKVHLVKRWARDGCVLIGDAAHTCSPAGAVGVSVAVETAIEAADVISRCLHSGNYSANALDKVQERREEDVRRMHVMQKRVAGGIAVLPPSLSWFTATAFYLGSQTPFFPRLLRRLAGLSSGLQVPAEFRF